MATEKQIEANRANALKSTGPVTEEGKQRCRRNALKHGLAAREMLPEADEAEARRRAAEWGRDLKAETVRQKWLVDRMAEESVRVDLCTVEGRVARQQVADRAAVSWDSDRRKQADLLGKKLAADPDFIRLCLEETPQGCDWLLRRWESWVTAAEAGDVGVDKALDLLGLPKDERTHNANKATVEAARAEISRIQARRAEIRPLDEAERDMAEVGMGDTVEAATRRLRRYESGCMRRLQWAQAQFEKTKAGLPESPKSPYLPKPSAVAVAPAAAIRPPVAPTQVQSEPIRPAAPVQSEPIRATAPTQSDPMSGLSPALKAGFEALAAASSRLDAAIAQGQPQQPRLSRRARRAAMKRR